MDVRATVSEPMEYVYGRFLSFKQGTGALIVTCRRTTAYVRTSLLNV